LIDNEYNDISVCEEILSLPQIYKEKIKVDMNPSGKFKAILTNPPYNVGNNPNYYLKHVEKHRDLLEDGGHYLAIMPNRFLAPFSKAGNSSSKWLKGLETVGNNVLTGGYYVGQTVGTLTTSINA
jgi:16S rRNA G1207 methylase RsmC